MSDQEMGCWMILAWGVMFPLVPRIKPADATMVRVALQGSVLTLGWIMFARGLFLVWP